MQRAVPRALRDFTSRTFLYEAARGHIDSPYEISPIPVLAMWPLANALSRELRALRIERIEGVACSWESFKRAFRRFTDDHQFGSSLSQGGPASLIADLPCSRASSGAARLSASLVHQASSSALALAYAWQREK